MMGNVKNKLDKQNQPDKANRPVSLKDRLEALLRTKIIIHQTKALENAFRFQPWYFSSCQQPLFPRDRIPLPFPGRNEQAIRALNLQGEEIPKEFKCGITNQVMTDPVSFSDSDTIFERSHIIHLLRNKLDWAAMLSSMDAFEKSADELIDKIELKNKIEKYIKLKQGESVINAFGINQTYMRAITYVPDESNEELKKSPRKK